MDIEKYKKWTEFDWEVELKQEDENINSYTAKLSNYLDLPNESEVIWKHLSHTSSMPGNTFLSNRDDFDLDDLDNLDNLDNLDDDLFFDSVDQKSDSEIYLEIESLASEFSRLISTVIDVKATSIGVKVLCFYGNTISKILDIEELGESEMPALKRALAKRIVANINSILGCLNVLLSKECFKKNIDILENQISRLFELRMKILNIQFECKLT